MPMPFRQHGFYKIDRRRKKKTENEFRAEHPIICVETDARTIMKWL